MTLENNERCPKMPNRIFLLLIDFDVDNCNREKARSSKAYGV